MRKLLIIFIGLLIGLFFLGITADQSADHTIPFKESALQQPTASESYTRSVNINRTWGKMPLCFIENQGQVDERVAYYIKGSNKTIYFTKEGLTYVLSKKRKKEKPINDKKNLIFPEDKQERRPEFYQRWVVKLDFVGARKDVTPIGLEKTETIISYFKGKPEEWKTGLSTFSRIIYRDLWPGIDLVYYGTMDRMKYEFVVRPGADPSQIKLAYSGVESVKLNSRGRLEIKTPMGGFEDEEPAGYQKINNKQVAVEMTYALEQDKTKKTSDQKKYVYGFEVGDYDRSVALILDPAVLVYCGYIGGSSGDYGSGIAVDSSGNAYVVGRTSSTQTTFPETGGPDLAHNGSLDVFVAKVNSSGTALVYCGYIGGSGDEFGFGIRVDNSGNAYVTGYTASDETTFPKTVGPDLTHNGDKDAFVAKVNSSGTSLVYCGYIGGSGDDRGVGITVDSSGNAYVMGTTTSTQTTFPETGGPDLTHNGGTQDAFVAKVNSSGTALVYCGYIGGSSYDYGYEIAVDSSGNAYVTGYTASDENTFPETGGPDLTHNGDTDAFVAKVNSSGTALVYCGYIGGSSNEIGYGIAIDSSGNAYVIGQTSSTQATFPETGGPDLTHNGGNDAFVAKVNSSGTALVYCGYIGGSNWDNGSRIAVDSSGNAYVSGRTGSDQTTFPVTAGPDLTYNGGTYDAFVAKVNSSGIALVYCGYIGGSGEDKGAGIAVDSSGNVYVTGETESDQTTFPETVGPDLTYNGGTFDAFVAKITHIHTKYRGVVALNADGTGGDELCCDFGSNGLWVYYGTWLKLNAADPDWIMGFEYSGTEYLLCDFGSAGLWYWYYNGSWSGQFVKVTSANPDWGFVVDDDADGHDEVLLSFGANGLWRYNMGAATILTKLHATSPNMGDSLRCDLWTAGHEEGALDFDFLGLWTVRDNGGSPVWNKINASGPSYNNISAECGIGDSAEELVIDFEGTGLWLYDGTTWHRLKSDNPDNVISAYLPGAADNELFCSFNGVSGLWMWDYAGYPGTWTLLSGTDPDSDGGFCEPFDPNDDGWEEVAVDFDSSGLWLYDHVAATKWAKLNNSNPEFMIRCDYYNEGNDTGLVVDFGAAVGLWLYNGKTGAWTKLSTFSPDGVN